ncbi:MAG: ABC transporter permease [Lachnospiraceae bacterium]|jgi:taurine transport system permease protein|uniref:ABC transporter permease n=1 Tax=Candidatus Merdisoma sp. JLR.KK006 TaxID=3112626 RepID=UPI002FF41BA4|nr:ABC transporter permease [Lachnospiraceae bacterium]
MENKKKNRIKYLSMSIAGLIVFFGLWEISVRLGWVSNRTLSPPSAVIQTFVFKLTNVNPDGSTLPQHFLQSLKLALSSFVVAVIIGVPLGWVMGYYKVASFLLNPIFEIIRPIPPIAWIPIIILTMGIGMPAKMFIIFVAAFVPCVINSYLGIRLTDPVRINVAKTFGASEWEIFTTVCIPSSMNMVFTGIRLSLNNSWTTLVAAEMLAATRGLGYMIQLGRTLIRPDIIIVGMFTIGITGALLNNVLALFEKKAAPWRYRE